MYENINGRRKKILLKKRDFYNYIGGKFLFILF